MEDKEQVTARIAGIVQSIPPMPTTVMALRKVAADPNANYDKILPLLSKDPALCSDLLRYANSALYGVGHKIDTIAEAARYFGMDNLADFVASSYSEKIIRKSFKKIKGLEVYFQHSADVSLASSIMAGVLGMDAHTKEVFAVSGLLHDIGRLVILLATAGDQVTSSLLGASWDSVRQTVDQQEEMLGLSHAELGGDILRNWKFPANIEVGVRRHHSPVVGEDVSFEGTVVFLGDVITIDALPDIVLTKALPPWVMKKIGLTEQGLLGAKNQFFQLKSGHAGSHGA